MRLRPILCLLLLLPGLVLGQGWSLRICMFELLGIEACCNEPAQPSCCADEAPRPAGDAGGGGASRAPRTCDVCCIEIDTSRERPTPVAEGAERALERVQLGAQACSVPSVAAAPAVTWLVRTSRGSAPPPPRAGAPLPLRI